MENLIGSGKVNAILGRNGNTYLRSIDLKKILEKLGVYALGADGNGNLLWPESKVTENSEKVNQYIYRELETKQEEPEKQTESSVSSYITSYVAEIEELGKQISTVKTQNQAIHAKLSIVVSAMKGHSQSTETIIDSEKIINELAGFIGSYMADQQRILTQQIDSAITSIDSKIDQIQKSVIGQSRCFGDIKSGMSDIGRQQNSMISNGFTSQKATREEIVKAISRQEQSIDQCREELLSRLSRIESAQNKALK